MVSKPLVLTLTLTITLPSTFVDAKEAEISNKTSPNHTHTNITLSQARVHPTQSDMHTEISRTNFTL